MLNLMLGKTIVAIYGLLELLNSNWLLYITFPVIIIAFTYWFDKQID